MFKGKVLRRFVDRETKQRYRPGDEFEAGSENRRDEIIAAGDRAGSPYVDFDEGESDAVDFDSMTVAELKDFAEANDIEVNARRKVDIIGEIESALIGGE